VGCPKLKKHIVAAKKHVAAAIAWNTLMAMGSSPDSFQALAQATIFLAGMLHTLKLQFCGRIRRL
jgi:hypothetical protein